MTDARNAAAIAHRAVDRLDVPDRTQNATAGDVTRSTGKSDSDGRRATVTGGIWGRISTAYVADR
jgi:hypothetical protein